ncbi:hypothetical protein [Nonomuraea dietziae]|uniref:hypothetical protein n=1 Tax=Nonomuraea dietziae TaxID=65515 RepID=UPI0033DB931A
MQSANFFPDIDAIREFVKQLKVAFDEDPEQKIRFSEEPNAFLGERGLARDLQRELLAEFGVAGADSGCSFSCVLSEGCFTTQVEL